MDAVAQQNKHGKNLKVRVRNLFWRIISVLPDKPYLRLKYATIFGRFPDFHHPKRFSELQQIRKLVDRRSLYNVLVDKAEVKNYVEERAGEQYVIPSYWVGTTFDSVDWETVPLPAVVKPTHSSGAGYFLRSAEDITRLMQNRPEAEWLAVNHYDFNREWAYKDLKPRIVIEKMLGHQDEVLTDYRFYCFNGEAVHIEIRTPIDGQMYEAIYTPDWRLTPIHMDFYPRYGELLPRPAALDEMLAVAKKLGAGISFARIDLYNTDEGIFVGEITLYPSGGFETFVPDSYDVELADRWQQSNETGSGEYQWAMTPSAGT
jgi:hypothetical protein